MDTHLIFAFKRALHYSTLVIKLLQRYKFVLSNKCYRNTMNQSSFKRLFTRTAHPLLKLKC